jgi:CheY-like chemotaxis protein
VQLPTELDTGTETILLVEDEEIVRGIASEILERQGYTVLVAADPDEALTFAQHYEGDIHLLLTDVVMPKMGGRDLAARVAAARPNAAVLYTSGYTDAAIVHHGVVGDGLAFLQKPFTRKVLVRRVREVLDAVAEREAATG